MSTAQLAIIKCTIQLSDRVEVELTCNRFGPLVQRFTPSPDVLKGAELSSGEKRNYQKAVDDLMRQCALREPETF